MVTKTAPYKLGDKVAGMYNDGRGLVWDPSGVVTACTPEMVTVQYKGGHESQHAIPIVDEIIDYLRICTSCGKPSTFKHCIGNGGCGALTERA